MAWIGLKAQHRMKPCAEQTGGAMGETGMADTFDYVIVGSGAASDQLLVHGLQGSRVVDASIIPAAKPYSSMMMIAEKASDMIRGRQPLTQVEGIAA